MKNFVTNIAGGLFIFVGVYGLLYLDLDITRFSVLLLFGFIMIYLENKTIKKYIKKALDKYV